MAYAMLADASGIWLGIERCISERASAIFCALRDLQTSPPTCKASNARPRTMKTMPTGRRRRWSRRSWSMMSRSDFLLNKRILVGGQFRLLVARAPASPSRPHPEQPDRRRTVERPDREQVERDQHGVSVHQHVADVPRKPRRNK